MKDKEVNIPQRPNQSLDLNPIKTCGGMVKKC